jgi:hypothetical protein
MPLMLLLSALVFLMLGVIPLTVYYVSVIIAALGR